MDQATEFVPDPFVPMGGSRAIDTDYHRRATTIESAASFVQSARGSTLAEGECFHWLVHSQTSTRSLYGEVS